MFFDATAWAMAGGQAAEQNPIMGLMPLIVMFAIFYFLLIRPQQKKVKEHRAMLDALEKGAEVVTAGGVVGRITRLDEAFVTVEVANGVEILLQKQAISQLLPKGTMKSA